MNVNQIVNTATGQNGSSGPSTATTAVHTPASSSENTSSRYGSGSDSPTACERPKPWDGGNFTFPGPAPTTPLNGMGPGLAIRTLNNHAANPGATQPRLFGGFGRPDILNPSSPEAYRHHNLSHSKDSWSSNDGLAGTLSHSRISSTSTAVEARYQGSAMAGHSEDAQEAGAATGEPQQHRHRDDGYGNALEDGLVNHPVVHTTHRPCEQGPNQTEEESTNQQQEGQQTHDAQLLNVSNREMGSNSGCLQPDPYGHASWAHTARGEEHVPKLSSTPELTYTPGQRLPMLPSLAQTIWPEPSAISRSHETRPLLGSNEGNQFQPYQPMNTARPSEASPPSPPGAQQGEGEGQGEGPDQGTDGEDGPQPRFDPNEVPTEPLCMWVENCNTQSTLRKIISHVFGRNKLCTRQIPEAIWVHMCRKHYQRVRYRNTDRFAKIQVDLVLKQLTRLEAWSRENERLGKTSGRLQSWTLGVRKREQKRTEGGGETNEHAPSRKRAREENSNGAVEESEGDDERGLPAPVPWQAQERKKGGTVPNAVPDWLRAQCRTGYSTEEIRQIVLRLQEMALAGDIEQIPDIELLPTITVDQDEESNRQKYRRRNHSSEMSSGHNYAHSYDGSGSFGGPPGPMPGSHMYRPSPYGGPYSSNNGYANGGGFGLAAGSRAGDMYSGMSLTQPWQTQVNTYDDGYHGLPARTMEAHHSVTPAVSPLWHPGMSSVGNRATSETYPFGDTPQRPAPFPAPFQLPPLHNSRPASQSRAMGDPWDGNWRTNFLAPAHTRSQSDRLAYTSDQPRPSVESAAEATASYNSSALVFKPELWPDNGTPLVRQPNYQLAGVSHAAHSPLESERQTNVSVAWLADASAPRRYHDNNQQNGTTADYLTGSGPLRHSAPAAQDSGQGPKSEQTHGLPYGNALQ